MDDMYLTVLDRAGMARAAQEAFEERFRIRHAHRQHGKLTSLESLEDLLKRDRERAKDGFPQAIKFRRVLVGAGKVIVVPYVESGGLFHGEFEPKHIVKFSRLDDEDEEDADITESAGHGDGHVGDVIGRMPLGGGAGEDNGPEPGDEEGDHGFEEEAYETGKRLTERLKLPNLKDKRKKVPTDEYIYDLTDRHQGSGQVLDKRETLRRAVKANIVLGQIDRDNLDPANMLIGPNERVFRVLSRQRVWKSQAVAIFLRDWSGSMYGDPTKAAVDQHLMLFALLLVQYEKRVIPRFFVHDVRAQEVTAGVYFNKNAGGGTLIASGYQKISEIVEGESLARDYNIYVFQATDGDDGDDGTRALPEIRKILGYVNRMGVTLFKSPYHLSRSVKTQFEEYVEKGGILSQRDVFRMHSMPGENVTEEMNLEAIKALLAQD